MLMPLSRNGFLISMMFPEFYNSPAVGSDITGMQTVLLNHLIYLKYIFVFYIKLINITCPNKNNQDVYIIIIQYVFKLNANKCILYATYHLIFNNLWT